MYVLTLAVYNIPCSEQMILLRIRSRKQYDSLIYVVCDKL